MESDNAQSQDVPKENNETTIEEKSTQISNETNIKPRSSSIQLQVPEKDSKSSSTSQFPWGGFLNKAVANLEQKLDKVLLETNETAIQKQASRGLAQNNSTRAASGNFSSSPSFSANSSRSNTPSNAGSSASPRISVQERLAAAMNKSNKGITQKVPRAEQQPKVDIQKEKEPSIKKDSTQEGSSESADVAPSDNVNGNEIEEELEKDIGEEKIKEEEYDVAECEKKDRDVLAEADTEKRENVTELNVQEISVGEVQEGEMQEDQPKNIEIQQDSMEKTISEKQKESNTDNEKEEELATTPVESTLQSSNSLSEKGSNSIQSKDLQNEQEPNSQDQQKGATVAETVINKHNSEVKDGIWERRLAEKDEKINLLMQEGIALSKTELKNMNTIKKLRLACTDHEKTITDLKNKISRLEREIKEQKESLKRYSENERAINEKLKTLSKLQSNLVSLRQERDGAVHSVEALHQEVKILKGKLDEGILEAQTEALEKEKAAHASTKTMFEKMKDGFFLQVSTLEEESKSAKLALEKEKTSFLSQILQARNEISSLESKVELLRVQLEESASAKSDETQAKQLRQIERLHAQHSQALEEWQQMEKLMESRIDGIEKEREWLVDRQKKDQEQIQSLQKRVVVFEDELIKTQSEYRLIQHSKDSLQQELTVMESKLFSKEAELKVLKEKHEVEKEEINTRLEKEYQIRLAKEKEQWEDQSGEYPSRRNSIGVSNLQISQRHRPLRVLSSAQSLFSVGEDAKLAGFSSAKQEEWFENDAGSVDVGTEDDGNSTAIIPVVENGTAVFDFTHTSQSAAAREPFPTRESSISATAEEGRNVSMIKRLSALVRRLEGEMVGARDRFSELEKLNNEKKEENERLVAKVAQTHEWEEKCKQKEKELEGLSTRYDDALELLGERTEQVEEMKLDIQDLKQALRESLQELTQQAK